MWILIILIYFAPADAVDWRGSYELGIAETHKEHFASEQSCLNKGERLKAIFNEGALAPFRYHCMEVPPRINN